MNYDETKVLTDKKKSEWLVGEQPMFMNGGVGAVSSEGCINPLGSLQVGY